MFCWNCGKEIDNNANFCNFCGKRQEKQVPAYNSNRPQKTSLEQQIPSKNDLLQSIKKRFFRKQSSKQSEHPTLGSHNNKRGSDSFRDFSVKEHTNNDIIENVSTRFDFTSIPYITVSETSPPWYLLNGDNKEVATQDILSLNGFLDHARDVCPKFPIVQIQDNRLQFTPQTDPEDELMFCHLQTSVYTKTGKLSKYPMSLHFSEASEKPYIYDPNRGYRVHHLPDKTFGTIDYFSNGEVGKVWMVCWKNERIYTLQCKTNIYGFLELSKIEKDGSVMYKSETADIQPPDSSEPKSRAKPKTTQNVITHYKEESAYHTLSETEIEDIQSVIEFVFDQFDIPSKVLTHRVEQEYTEYDISVPDGVRLKKLLSFRDEIDIRIPKTTIDMQPDYERGVVVIRVKHQSEPIMIPYEEVVETQTEDHTETGYQSEEDSKILAAIDIVVRAGMASTTLLQRQLNIGYSRAARLIDELEERKIVGPFEGSKPRKVLITPAQWEELRNNQFGI